VARKPDVSRVERLTGLADAYERYAALIIAQLEAIERDEVDALELLSEQRARLADEIDAIASTQADLAADEEARQQLERCLAADPCAYFLAWGGSATAP